MEMPQFFKSAKESWLSLPDFCMAIFNFVMICVGLLLEQNWEL